MRDVPWPHYVNEEKGEVWVHVESGFPETIGVPYVISRFYPGYHSKLCSKDFLDKLIRESL